ncbi:UPF0175 family protein [Geitlerinema sp. CS-897]|nr:UPF0175 family protein [Geitlerinema sp. CS-897]
MTRIALDLPDSVFSALQTSPSEFAIEMRIAAAVKGYELEVVLHSNDAGRVQSLLWQEFKSQSSITPHYYPSWNYFRRRKLRRWQG